jgi:hypothetical protein
MKAMLNADRARLTVALLLVTTAVLLIVLANGDLPRSVALGTATAPDSGPTVTPTPDRLAIPVLPESPTQLDIGSNLYYYHCMPCHGDRGQGLTDEWRQVWVEDHQDCWARGCHTGKASDEGFPIPRYVPPVSGSPHVIGGFREADDLFDFLRYAHPPQRPGALSDDECWALTAFVLHENGRLPPDVEVGPSAIERSEPRAGIPFAVALGLVLVVILALWAGRRAIHR